MCARELAIRKVQPAFNAYSTASRMCLFGWSRMRASHNLCFASRPLWPEPPFIVGTAGRLECSQMVGGG